MPTQLFKKNNKKIQGQEFNAFKIFKNTTLNSTWILEFGVQTWFYDNLLSNT